MKPPIKLVLPVIYLCAWAASVALIWSAGTVDLIGVTILSLYVLMPLVTAGTSLVAGLRNVYGRFAWIGILASGVLYMLIPYVTFSLANTLATGNLHAPDLMMLIVGLGLSLISYLVGLAIRHVRDARAS